MDSRTARALTVLSTSLLITIMMAVSLSLTACGGGQAAGTASASTSPSEEAEVDKGSTAEKDDEADAAADEGQAALAADYNLEGTLTEPIEGDYATGVHHATIEVDGFGTIKLELNANVAPITVSNFAQLVEDGFYDGLTFHRIIDGFMIQGGDPNGDGSGGSARTIKGEFFTNGVKNTIQHKRGTISMARLGSDYDSASSQFFIVHQTSANNTAALDQNYAAFGKVTEGMEVVDSIAQTQVEDGNGTVLAENQPRITSIRMDD